MNRHQRAPATRREAPNDACVAFGRKTSAAWPTLLQPATAESTACILPAPASANVDHSRKITSDTSHPALRKNRCNLRARAGAHSKKATPR